MKSTFSEPLSFFIISFLIARLNRPWTRTEGRADREKNVVAGRESPLFWLPLRGLRRWSWLNSQFWCTAPTERESRLLSLCLSKAFLPYMKVLSFLLLERQKANTNISTWGECPPRRAIPSSDHLHYLLIEQILESYRIHSFLGDSNPETFYLRYRYAFDDYCFNEYLLFGKLGSDELFPHPKASECTTLSRNSE